MNPQARSVRLVVLNFNGDPYVHHCLRRLFELDYPADRLDVVVVDNASTDGSADAIEAEFPRVTLIRRPGNDGFGANNVALEDLDGVDYVGLVNPDAFVESGWLSPLVDTLESDPGLAAACPKILLTDTADVAADPGGAEIINNAGGILIEGGWGADRGLGEGDVGQYDEPCDVFSWTGGGVLLRPEYLDDVGLFDETFFLYYEDMDMAWRGRIRGWRYRYVPQARMHHLHSAATVQGSAMFDHHVERNRLVMLAKNAPAGFAAWAWLRFLLSTASIARREVTDAWSRRTRPDVTSVRRRLSSWMAAVGLLPHALRERRIIRRRRLVADADILSWQVPR